MPTAPGNVPGIPKAQGLYDPTSESDACGVGYVVSIDGIQCHKLYIFSVTTGYKDNRAYKSPTASAT
ncbi:hypothetical protein KUTeg_007812 [Tegillarca granosa]|uniref:Glutamate synthase n=1 Tax=Tegillarca granosa TaxID=220873 RepID=A0ABQ9FGK2_TEGGR|nr:hypothetical protein KUTeg_007812 [Tegillarca granosa]